MRNIQQLQKTISPKLMFLSRVWPILEEQMFQRVIRLY